MQSIPLLLQAGATAGSSQAQAGGETGANDAFLAMLAGLTGGGQLTAGRTAATGGAGGLDTTAAQSGAPNGPPELLTETDQDGDPLAAILAQGLQVPTGGTALPGLGAGQPGKAQAATELPGSLANPTPAGGPNSGPQGAGGETAPVTGAPADGATGQTPLDNAASEAASRIRETAQANGLADGRASARSDATTATAHTTTTGELAASARVAAGQAATQDAALASAKAAQSAGDAAATAAASTAAVEDTSKTAAKTATKTAAATGDATAATAATAAPPAKTTTARERLAQSPVDAGPHARGERSAARAAGEAAKPGTLGIGGAPGNAGANGPAGEAGQIAATATRAGGALAEAATGRAGGQAETPDPALAASAAASARPAGNRSTTLRQDRPSNGGASQAGAAQAGNAQAGNATSAAAQAGKPGKGGASSGAERAGGQPGDTEIQARAPLWSASLFAAEPLVEASALGGLGLAGDSPEDGLEVQPGASTTNSPGAAKAVSQSYTGAAMRGFPGAPSAQVAVHIQRAINNQVNRFNIQLEPAELGRVDVRLDFARDGSLRASITVERPETLDLMQRDLQNLERSLKDFSGAGQQLSLDLNLGSGAQQEREAWREALGDKSPQASRRGEPGPEAAIEPATIQSGPIDGLVDIRI